MPIILIPAGVSMASSLRRNPFIDSTTIALQFAGVVTKSYCSIILNNNLCNHYWAQVYALPKAYQKYSSARATCPVGRNV